MSDKGIVLTTTTSPSNDTNATDADRLADERWHANLRALSYSQPRLAEALRREQIHVSEWIFARDGALTAFTGPGRWWTGCSLPHRAASAMLRTLQVSGVVGCLLDPPHAAHVRVALDKLRRNQAVAAVCPDLPQLALLLHCDDFSGDVAANRLWFAWGGDWAAELGNVFEERPGLPTPSTFIRLPTHDDATIDRLVKQAQAAFAAETGRRAGAMKSIRGRAHGASADAPVAVIAPSLFRLWDGAPQTLAGLLPHDARRLDTDDPASASPLALGAATDGAAALLTADLARADAPQLLPDAQPWITWVTTPRVPAHVPAAGRDALLLADPAWREAARTQGWPDDRIAVAAWPTRREVPSMPVEPLVALIADTKPLAAPQRLEDYSSHRLLWEQIATELSANPFAAIDGAEQYLTSRRQQAGIDPSTFDPRPFLTDLITPAVAQGLARVMLEAGLPLRLHGKGWAEIETCSRSAAGAVTSRDDLLAAVDGATVLVDPRPAPGAHPIHSIGRGVVRPGRQTARQFVDQVRRALAAPPTPAVAACPLSFERIRAFL